MVNLQTAIAFSEFRRCLKFFDQLIGHFLDIEMKKAGKVHRFRIPAVAAAAVALLILLPNTGADIAYAMGNIPVIGKLFQAVTFRDYQYESERFDANVEVPQIVIEDKGFS